MKNYIIPFYYNVFNGRELMFGDVHNMHLGESDIKNVAEILADNGGHPMEVPDLGSLSDRVIEDIFVNEITERIPEGTSLDDIYVELDSQMPDELLAAVEPLILSKRADVKFYYLANGEERTGSVSLGISTASFKKMVEAVAEDHCGLSDFDFLKGFAPEAYAEISELAKECAFKECQRLYGVTCESEIREFPVEVYNYV